jgi:uncharacterized protein YlxP (DUF503 family)
MGAMTASTEKVNMVVGVLQVRLAIYEAVSLKDKRRVVKSIKDRVGHKFNASIAEVDSLEDRRAAELAVAVVSNDARFAEGCLQKILAEIERHRGAVLVDYTIETL